jgi:hypothetical protein
MKVLWIAAALLAGAGATPAAAQTDLPNPSGDWLDEPTGVSFPVANGDSVRKKIHAFDENGRDIGVSYYLIQNGKPVGFTTLYVYPAPHGDCDAAWQIERAETLKHGYLILSEDRAPSPSGKTPDAAHHAMVDRHLGGPGNPVESATYFYCVPNGRWLVKYYASWKGTVSLEGETIALLHAVSWPEAFRH